MRALGPYVVATLMLSRNENVQVLASLNHREMIITFPHSKIQSENISCKILNTACSVFGLVRPKRLVARSASIVRI
jgi:hypothetical protein